MKTTLMSMKELERVARDKYAYSLEREACARELAKRENRLLHKSLRAWPVKAEDYLR